MKNFKIILLSIIGLFVTSCDLDEDPIFLDSNAVYSDISVAKGALDGIYQALTSYNAQERSIFAINGFSGLFAAGKNGGNNVNNINNLYENEDKHEEKLSAIDEETDDEEMTYNDMGFLYS